MHGVQGSESGGMVSETLAASGDIREFVDIGKCLAYARCPSVRLRILDDLMYLRPAQRKRRFAAPEMTRNHVPA